MNLFIWCNSWCKIALLLIGLLVNQLTVISHCTGLGSLSCRHVHFASISQQHRQSGEATLHLQLTTLPSVHSVKQEVGVFIEEP